MSAKKRSAGEILESKCTRCRALTNHTIVAMVGEKVVRVQCNTCGGQHNYHPPVEKKEPAARPVRQKTASSSTATPRARREPVPAGPSEWELAMPEMDRTKARPYDMASAYSVGNLIDHPTFGYGIVKVTIKPNKMEVLFENGLKMLRCTL